MSDIQPRALVLARNEDESKMLIGTVLPMLGIKGDEPIQVELGWSTQVKARFKASGCPFIVTSGVPLDWAADKNEVVLLDRFASKPKVQVLMARIVKSRQALEKLKAMPEWAEAFHPLPEPEPLVTPETTENALPI